MNRRRSEDNMLNLIENKYGHDVNLIIGDASIGKSMRHFISTPNIQLKRKLKERFNIYHIDEFKTSMLHYKTEEKCDNLHYEDKKKRIQLEKQLKYLTKIKKTDKIDNKIKYIKKYLASKKNSKITFCTNI